MQYHLKKLSNSTLKIDGLQTTFKIITWFTRGQYKSLSRLLLSSKSPPGVLEAKDAPETLGDGVGRVEIYQGIFPASLTIIG